MLLSKELTKIEDEIYVSTKQAESKIIQRTI